jgi:hypothetical protein
VNEVVRNHLGELVDNARIEALVQALIDREDQIAAGIRLMAERHGAFPELTAFVMTQVGLGSEVDQTTLEFLHAQYHSRIEWLQQQMGDNG